MGAGARALQPLLRRNLPFRGLVLRCAAAHLPDFAAAAACDALQPLRQRAALRLLALHASARAGPSTQEPPAEMLGARRPTVSAAPQGLDAEGLPSTARGRTTVAGAQEGAASPLARRARWRRG